MPKYYSYEELTYRPIEHMLEDLTAVELADAWGLAKKQQASALRTGMQPMSANHKKRLRRYVEAKAAEEVAV